jgi:hypothetical protein
MFLWRDQSLLPDSILIQGATNIRDELSEVLFLSDVKVPHRTLPSGFL